MSRHRIAVCAAAVALSLSLVGCKKKTKPSGSSPAPEPGPASSMPPDPSMATPKPAPVKPKPKPPTPEPLPKGVWGEPVLWLSVAEVNQNCDKHLETAGALKAQAREAKGPRTKQNTLLPLNGVLIEIDRLINMATLIGKTHPDKKVREAAEKCEKRGKKFVTELTLDVALYQGLKKVDLKAADARTKRFHRHLVRDFRRAGADKDAATRKKLKALQEKMVDLGQIFDRNILKDKKSLEVTEADLKGMPADFIATRKKRKASPGKIKLTTDYPDFFAVEKYAQSEKLRRDLYRLFLTRAYPANVKVLTQLLATRHTYATMLGYPSWAAYEAETKMVKKAPVIANFVERVAKLARPRMHSDLAEILAAKKKEDPKATRVEVWDRFYFVRKIRQAKFKVDSAQVRAHFEFGRVKEGILKLAQELFAVRFQRVAGARVWHPTVEAYDVFDGAKRLGRFYLDLHPRQGKYGHAAMFPLLSGIKGKQLAAAALVCNFPDPAVTQPALTEHHQVSTFFHELGHLVHQLLGGDHDWIPQSGANPEMDFVEAPSQILEEWTWDPKVLGRFAKHHKTGKPIPAALVERMRKAQEFGKGVHVMRQMFYAALSFRLHHLKSAQPLLQRYQAIMKQYNPYGYLPGTGGFASFGHLNGYSSMYYTYMWSLVLAKDLFTRFQKNGLMDRQTALAYRRDILAPGGSIDAVEMVEKFLGRPYRFAAFQKWLQK